MRWARYLSIGLAVALLAWGAWIVLGTDASESGAALAPSEHAARAPLDEQAHELRERAEAAQQATPERREGAPAPELAARAPTPGSPPAFHGVVRDLSGDPLAGALVRCRVLFGALGLETQAVHTDRSGRYEIHWRPSTADEHALFEELAVQERQSLRALERWTPRRSARGRDRVRDHVRRQWRPPVVELSADFPGHMTATRGAALPERGSSEVDFVLAPGTMLRGRVEGPWGPAGGAEVLLLHADDLRKVWGTRADLAGGYALGVPEPGVYHIYARKENEGAGALRAIELPPLDDAPLPELVLEGEGLLAGSVRYPDGRPCADVRVQAVPEAFAFEEPPSIPEERRIAEELAGGLFGDEAHADHTGIFELRGLKPGKYWLRFPGLGDPALQPVDLVATPAGEVVLEYAGHRIAAKVELGGEAERARVGLRWRALDPGGGPAAAPQSHELLAGATHRFAVLPGTEYLVEASARDHQDESLKVLVRGSTFETEVELFLAPRPELQLAELGYAEEESGPSTAVELRVLAPSGQPRDGRRVRLVRETEIGAALGAPATVAVPAAGLVHELEPGLWRAEVEALPDTDEPEVLREPRRFRVDAGERVPLALELVAGGFVTLAFPPAAGEEAAPRLFLATNEDLVPRPLDLTPAGDPGRLELRSECLPPGPQRLQIEHGARRWTAMVEVAAGETTRVRLSDPGGER